MLSPHLFVVVKAIRLRYAVLFVLLLVGVYMLGIHPWMRNWGSTSAERQMTLPGDDTRPEGTRLNTLALTIQAPADVVWQWLVQIGQDRAGFYSYTWLENLVGADIHNANEVHPEWQNLAVGDGWRLIPPDYLWGLGKEAVSPVLLIEPGRALVLEMFGAHVILPVDEHTSRLIVRSEVGPANPVQMMVIDPLVFTMERRMLLGLKARAEGRPDAPIAFMTFARLGWAAAGITVAGLFLNQRRRWFWMALPILVALPTLLMSHDLQAALSGFTAAGIVLLGFLIYGRSWWGPLLVISSVVLLTLLLAPEAYIAIGLAFALLLLAATAAMVAGRSRNVNDAVGRLVTPTRERRRATRTPVK